MYFKISNPMDYHVALYIRLSKEDETEGPSGSVTNQKSLLLDFAKTYNLFVCDIYIDDGWSGTNFDRPDFNRMISDIEAGKVNMVITKDLSRLGRDYILTGYYMEKYFPEHSVRYISLLDGVDTGVDSSANDITPFRAIMNDMYAKDISKKIKSIKHDKQRKGLFIGGKATYGYKLHPTEKNTIIIDEEAAKIVRYVFKLALDGTSCRQIAVDLNNKGIPTPATYANLLLTRKGPYSGQWSSERVSDMLQNEMYIGNMVQGKTVKVSYKSTKTVKQPRDNWIIVENTHEPIIEKEVFFKVQELIRSRKHTRSRTYDFLFKGLIYCHECGYPLTVLNRKNAAGEDVLYFVCRTYQRFTKSGRCTSHTIKVSTITDAVLDKIRRICGKYIKKDELLSIAQNVVSKSKNCDRTEEEIQELKKKVAAITNNLDKMYMDKLSGVLTETDFERIYSRIKEERSNLEIRINEMSQMKKYNIKSDEIAEKMVNQFLNSACTNRELLVSLVERIELTKTKEVIIKFRFRELENITA